MGMIDLQIEVLEGHSYWADKAYYTNAERKFYSLASRKISTLNKSAPSPFHARDKRKKENYFQQKGLTPYQGKDRCFGEYKCSHCKHHWKSGNSWANTAQRCVRCMIMIYPYKQQKLESNGGFFNEKRNSQRLRERCHTDGNYYRSDYTEDYRKIVGKPRYVSNDIVNMV